MALTMTLTTCPVTDHKLAVEGKTVSRPYCRMGQDYDCGCVYCSHSSYAAATAAAAEWNAETAEHRAWVVTVTGALACLAVIGRAMNLVASMPGAIREFSINAATVYHNVPSKGTSYRVTGKAGNAKHHQGKVGVCKWIGEATYNNRPANWRGHWQDNHKPTVRIGLAVEGEAKLVYVPFKQVERIADAPAVIAAQLARQIIEVTLAEANVLPRWTGTLPGRRSKKNPPPVAHVVSGRDKGASGSVFWIGADKRTGEADARLGIRCANGSTVWASVYDCRNEAADTTPADERAITESVAADAVQEGKLEKARELLAKIV